MGPHSRPGNCEWDVVVVCRPNEETQPSSIPVADEFWNPHCGDLTVGDADLTSFDLAYKVASQRFGKPMVNHSRLRQLGGTNGCVDPRETDFHSACHGT